MSQLGVANGFTRAETNLPMVVDLDEALLRIEFFEVFFSLLADRPAAAFAAIRTFRKDNVAIRNELGRTAVLGLEMLPLNGEVIDFLKAEKSKGRKIYLASGSNRPDVERIANYVGLFDGVFASDDGSNFSGAIKANYLVDAFGERGFDYVGGQSREEPVWQRARAVYLANASPARIAAMRARAPYAHAIRAQRLLWREYIRAMRAHQWLKNLLIFAPALAAHRFHEVLLPSLLAFVSFSLCASSVYILNDLLDLRNDRVHPRRRFRVFAAGQIPIMHGVVLCAALLFVSLTVAIFLPGMFLLVLAGYFFLTCAYSLDLKRRMLVDVVTLACLYGSRVAAGGAATGVLLSPWLIAFALFLFFSLALVKRWAELSDHLDWRQGDPAGRGYRLDDLPAIRSMATASGYVSVLVLALYINGDAVAALYRHPERLWLNCVLLLFWVSHVIMITHRGYMHDDPLIFAATDRISLFVALAGAAVTISAIL
jgi:4-hydroxybenzoate polyprenyltransferase